MATQDKNEAFAEVKFPVDGVKVVIWVNKVDGQEGEAQVMLEGGFTINATDRKEFLDDLGTMLDLYRL